MSPDIGPPMDPGKRISEVWVFIAKDEAGDEGDVAVRLGETMLPLVASDRKRLELMREYAQRVIRETGTKIVLRRFVLTEDHEWLTP